MASSSMRGSPGAGERITRTTVSLPAVPWNRSSMADSAFTGSPFTATITSPTASGVWPLVAGPSRRISSMRNPPSAKTVRAPMRPAGKRTAPSPPGLRTPRWLALSSPRKRFAT